MALKITSGRALKHGWFLSVEAHVTGTYRDSKMNYIARVERVRNGLIERHYFTNESGYVPKGMDLNKLAGILAKEVTPKLPKLKEECLF